MGPDGGNHPGGVTQRTEMTGRSVACGDFRLCDDSTCAGCADDEGGLRLISLADVRDTLEECPTDAAEAALGIRDRLTGTPRDRAGGHRVRDAPVHRHRAPSPATAADHEVRSLEAAQQGGQAGRIVLAVGIDGDDQVHGRVEPKRLAEPGHQRRPLPAVHRVPHDDGGT